MNNNLYNNMLSNRWPICVCPHVCVCVFTVFVCVCNILHVCPYIMLFPWLVKFF